eukprot:IDg18906t1
MQRHVFFALLSVLGVDLECHDTQDVFHDNILHFCQRLRMLDILLRNGPTSSCLADEFQLSRSKPNLLY